MLGMASPHCACTLFPGCLCSSLLPPSLCFSSLLFSSLQQLTATGKSPQFNQFLVQILCTNPSPLEEAIRQLAGLLLKQNARHFVAWPASTQAMIKTTLLGALGLPQRHLRRTVAVAVTTIVSFIRLVGWKELLPAIAESLAPTVSAAAMDGAMYTATVLCEDFPTDMNSAELGWPLTVLIPKFIMFFKHPTPAFRRMALRCLLNFIFDMPSAMVTNMPTYLAGLSALTTDTDGDVRKYVCQSLVCLVEDRLDLLMPHIRPIIAFMIHSMLDENDEIQLAACEFWCPFIDAAENHAGILIEHFPKLIPAIWHCLRYSEEELADLPVDDVADEAIADREEDIQPFIYNRHKEGGGDVRSRTSPWLLSIVRSHCWLPVLTHVDGCDCRQVVGQCASVPATPWIAWLLCLAKSCSQPSCQASTSASLRKMTRCGLYVARRVGHVFFSLFVSSRCTL